MKEISVFSFAVDKNGKHALTLHVRHGSSGLGAASASVSGAGPHHLPMLFLAVSINLSICQ